MTIPVPQHVHLAQSQVAALLQKAEGRPVDLLKTPWAEIEKSVIKVLGGPFRVEQPDHQAVALGLAGAFAARLAEEQKAFWFPNRDAPEGASLGFPEALIVLSPFGAVMDALQKAKLARLDEIAGEIRTALGQVRFAPAGGAAQGARIGPEDYQRLFDPSFLQFVVLDPARVKSTLEARPDALARDLRDALGRTQPPLPPELKQQFEAQLVSVLQKMDPQKPLADQVERAPRLVELMVHLFGTVGGTGSAPEELWQEMVFPLLFIGAPSQFPPVEAEELQAFEAGDDPAALFVDLVPYSHKAPEQGLLGAFEAEEVSLPHPSLGRAESVRLLKLGTTKLKPALEQFDPDRTRDALQRFTRYLEEKSGKPAMAAAPQGKELLNAALTLLSDLKRSVAQGNGELSLRRMTEGEAASEQALALVRKTLQGPRIILF